MTRRQWATLAYLFIGRVQGFQRITSPRWTPTRLFLANDKYDTEAASQKLLWETLEESNSKPLLNLSSREASLEEMENTNDDTSEWDQGQRWDITKQGLSSQLSLDVNEDALLQECPQLLRLEPSMVLETAEWIVQEFGVSYLQLAPPRLLSFRSTDVAYGLEFMSTMMMANAKGACLAAPALLLSGIEGGIQEQAVKNALGAAGDATTKASQRIVGDSMATLQQLQQQKRRKGL